MGSAGLKGCEVCLLDRISSWRLNVDLLFFFFPKIILFSLNSGFEFLYQNLQIRTFKLWKL